jgi:hypothetical protein
LQATGHHLATKNFMIGAKMKAKTLLCAIIRLFDGLASEHTNFSSSKSEKYFFFSSICQWFDGFYLKNTKMAENRNDENIIFFPLL